MSLSTSEAELEKQLEQADSDYQEVNRELSILRAEVRDLETEYVCCRLKMDKAKEELRRFRLTYPKLCK